MDTTMANTVLVVDDEELVRNVTCGMVARLGYRAVPANDGPSALAILRDDTEAAIDVAILDLTMPGMSGAETLKAMREVRPSLPVILSSGYSKSNVADAVARYGSVWYLAKPFQLSALRQRLEEAIG